MRFVFGVQTLAVVASLVAIGVPQDSQQPRPDPISVESSVPLTPPPSTPTPVPAPPFEPKPPVPPPLQEFSISGPESISLGMLSLTISGVTTTATTTGPIPAISWAVYPSEDIRVERNGHVVYYAAVTPKHVWFVASCNNVDPAAKPYLAMKLVTVGQPGPLPPTPVPPSPDDGKKPVPAPGGPLSAWITGSVTALVKSPDRKATAVKLAAEFTRVAGETWATPDEIVERMEAVSRVAVDPHEAEWQPFFDAMGDELGRRADAGTLKTVADHVQMLRDVSVGLRAVK